MVGKKVLISVIANRGIFQNKAGCLRELLIWSNFYYVHSKFLRHSPSECPLYVMVMYRSHRKKKDTGLLYLKSYFDPLNEKV